MRRAGTLLLVVGMVLFGTAVYIGLGSFKSHVATARKPQSVHARFTLPGSLYLVQEGALYVFRGGAFQEIQGQGGSWSQPALVPNGSGLIAVRRGIQYSDLYLLGLDGHVVRRLTSDSARYLQDNTWAYYPAVSPDSQTVYYSHDEPKFGYQVDFSIWSFPLAHDSRSGRVLTYPNYYTGGDVEPHPLASGALLYVKYAIDNTGVYSQLWLQRGRYDPGVALTAASEDCREPSLSPSGDRVAMICTQGRQESHLMVASFDGHTLGALHEISASPLAAVPVWAPDSSGLAYLAPDLKTTHFELWWLPVAAVDAAFAPSPAPSASPGPSPSPNAKHAVVPGPVEITTELDLDPLSAPAWSR